MTAPMPIFVMKGVWRSRELSNYVWWIKHMSQTDKVVRPEPMERVHLGPIEEHSNIVHSDSVCIVHERVKR